MSQMRITMSLADGIADVRLARPEKLNALDSAMFTAINDMIAAIADNRQVRVVILSGEGRAFCAGLDLDVFGADAPLVDLGPRTHGDANAIQNVAWGWRTLPVPVIAAVRGVALGAGFQIMLGADIRIAHPETRLSLMETQWGLVPDVGGIALMRGLVRDDIARELTYSARKISGAEAAALGVVTRVADDPYAEALALGRDIAAKSPAAIRAAKRLLNRMSFASAGELLVAEAHEQERLLRSAGHREAVAAARENRPPRHVDG